MSVDRPLTEPMELALIRFGAYHDEHSGEWGGAGVRFGRSNTVAALEARGLVESQLSPLRGLNFDYRITEAGLKMLASMGS